MERSLPPKHGLIDSIPTKTWISCDGQEKHKHIKKWNKSDNSSKLEREKMGSKVHFIGDSVHLDYIDTFSISFGFTTRQKKNTHTHSKRKNEPTNIYVNANVSKCNSSLTNWTLIDAPFLGWFIFLIVCWIFLRASKIISFRMEQQRRHRRRRRAFVRCNVKLALLCSPRFSFNSLIIIVELVREHHFGYVCIFLFYFFLFHIHSSSICGARNHNLK